MTDFFFAISILFATLTVEAGDFTECRTTKTTQLRMMPGTVEAGALAVNIQGEPVGLKEILADEMIYFKTPDGKITDTYQWMYNTIHKVEGRDNKFLSSSYGEDVIITVGEEGAIQRQNEIRYEGTKSGSYLTLTCN